jgi:hypothetical protein
MMGHTKGFIWPEAMSDIRYGRVFGIVYRMTRIINNSKYSDLNYNFP